MSGSANDGAAGACAGAGAVGGPAMGPQPGVRWPRAETPGALWPEGNGGGGEGEGRTGPGAAGGAPHRWASGVPSVRSRKSRCRASPALKVSFSMVPSSPSAARVTSSKAFASLAGRARLAICWTPKSDMAHENLSMD